MLTPPGNDPAVHRPSQTVAQVVKNLTECVIGGPNTYSPKREDYQQTRQGLMDQLPKR